VGSGPGVHVLCIYSPIYPGVYIFKAGVGLAVILVHNSRR